MTANQQLNQNAFRLERTYNAPAELIWELWTTPAGIEEWWAPDGFEEPGQQVGSQARRSAGLHDDSDRA